MNGLNQRKPDWLKAKIPSGHAYFKLKKELNDRNLSTICQSARCPNVNECWNRGHATFLAMGDTCSRGCSFCAVKKGKPERLDEREDRRILEMAQIMALTYLVVTSVTRDDLEDRGSGQLSRIVRTLKTARPNMKVEILIPDFSGLLDCLDRVLDAAPDVLSHNLETVRNLYPKVNRSLENYSVSLRILSHSHQRGAVTKSGIMVGLGESRCDLSETFADLRQAGVDIVTIGQYLQPDSGSLPVMKYYAPEEFVDLKRSALSFGFPVVEAGPFVRSSYHSDRLYQMVCDAVLDIQ
jgi:lipoic acid synthetase